MTEALILCNFCYIRCVCYSCYICYSCYSCYSCYIFYILTGALIVADLHDGYMTAT